MQQRYWLAPVHPEPKHPESGNISSRMASNETAQTGDEYLIGATYDRVNLKGPMEDSSRQDLIAGLREITSEDFTVVGTSFSRTSRHKDASTGRRKAPRVSGTGDPEWHGFEASLLAPAAAKQLMNLWDQPHEKSQQKAKPLSLTKLAHSIVKRAIQPGDTAIDATAGNGHDTLFLAQCVQQQGRVFSIDVQHSAIESTAEKLQSKGVTHVIQIEGDHSVILDQLTQESETARAIMFNLGYLPGGDKQRITTKDTTRKAVSSGLRLLSTGGVMTVTAYRGHPGGQEEASAVEEIAQQVPVDNFTVDVIPGSEENNESPILFVFRRQERRVR